MGACRWPFVTAVCGSLVQWEWEWGEGVVGTVGELGWCSLTSLSWVIFHGAIRNAVRAHP